MTTYFVYILASHTHRLYVGVTNDLVRRVHGHKLKAVEGFTAKYNINRLVYYETTNDIRAAIAREKQLKGWLRFRKYELIETMNPQWRDLAEDWHSEEKSAERSFRPQDLKSGLQG